MLDYTVDILLIGFIVVLMVQLIKAPVKAVLERKGLSDSTKMSKIFNAIVTLFSYVMCFVGSCIYFRYVKHCSLFSDAKILYYTVGVIGASQSIYKVLETYGRDGILAIIGALIDRAKAKKVTSIESLPSIEFSVLASQIHEGIRERFEDASITEEDVKQILEAKFINHT